MMCDWPVWDGYYRYDPPRMCGNSGGFTVGTMSLCSGHADMLMRSLTSKIACSEPHHGMARDVLDAVEQYLMSQPDDKVTWARVWALNEMRLRMLRRQQEPEIDHRKSWVYFVFREGFIKIGTTRDLRQRLKALAAGGSMPDGMSVGPVTLLAAIPGTRDNEQFFHRKFAHIRVDKRREWFLFTEELRTFISGLKGANLTALKEAA